MGGVGGGRWEGGGGGRRAVQDGLAGIECQ